MRFFLFLPLSLLAACSGTPGPAARSNSHLEPDSSFRVSIAESGAPNSGHAEWLVTPDSVSWMWKRPGGDHERVAEALPAVQRDRIRAQLARLDLRTLPAALRNDHPVAGLPEFYFTITVPGQQQEFRLSLARIPALLDLVATINGALPEKYGVPYTEEYLQEAQ